MTKSLILTGCAALALVAAPALAQTTGQASGTQSPPGAAPSTGSAPTATDATTTGTSATATTGAAASTTAPTKVAAGQTVSDASGGEVGRVESVNGAMAVVDTGTHKVNLPLTSFALGPKGPVMGMTKAELNAAAAQAASAGAADLKSQLTAGTPVKGAAGATVGTIKSVDGQYVVLAMTSGDIRLPLTAFAKGDGGPMIGMTLAQLEAAAKAAKPAAAAK